MMSDGRLFTDYRSNSLLNEYIKYNNKIKGDDNYRLFLQNNAKTLMDKEWSNLRKCKSCYMNNCVHNYPMRMYTPWFVEEKRNYNLAETTKANTYLCPKFNDYRITKM